VAKIDVGEKQMFRLTPLLHFLPYYLISNSVPYLITHQVLPRNYGYVIRLKIKIYRNFLKLLIYLYQILHISVKENFKKIFFGTKIHKLPHIKICPEWRLKQFNGLYFGKRFLAIFHRIIQVRCPAFIQNGVFQA
jgi:hypothetical protein